MVNKRKIVLIVSLTLNLIGACALLFGFVSLKRFETCACERDMGLTPFKPVYENQTMFLREQCPLKEYTYREDTIKRAHMRKNPNS